GYVFITRGLYNQAPTDDLLAGILGHEIGHITAKHALNIVRRGEFASVVGDQATKHNKNLQQAQSTAYQVQSQVASVSPEMAQMVDVSAGKILKTILEKGFDPKTEFAADRLGHDLAASTGYAPGGLRAVLTTLQTTTGDPKTLFPTHPPLKDRLQKLPNDPAPTGN
ncbi:MAG TPA: M48 family metalloprotease, partial [Candidatus Didemnitutus sp.]|nr:M48 family metalloprotease [Candidatus Didemnitutus sp.]